MGSNWTAGPYRYGILSPWEAIQFGWHVPRVYLASARLSDPRVIVTNITHPTSSLYWFYTIFPTPGTSYGHGGLSIPAGVQKFPWGEVVDPP